MSHPPAAPSPRAWPSALRRLLGIALATALCLPAQASNDTTLGLLAGQAPAAGLPSHLNTAAWKNYAQAVQRNWKQYRTQIGEPMQAWADKEVPDFRDTVFYPFSGPDFSTVSQLFPSAQRYILVALQAAEKPVDLAALKPEAATQTLEVLTTAWGFYGRDGFFVTEYLDKYLHANRVRIGAATFLGTFFQLKGLTVSSVVPIQVNAQGQIEELPPSEPRWRSVRFRLLRSGQPITVDYLRIDLSDASLTANPGQRKFIEQSASHPVLLKAASHLPQNEAFSIIARAVATHAPFVIQDETGLRYTQLKENFELTLYGNFDRPNKHFPGYQRDLIKAYDEAASVRPLSFRMGYFKDGDYALIVGRRRR